MEMSKSSLNYTSKNFGGYFIPLNILPRAVNVTNSSHDSSSLSSSAHIEPTFSSIFASFGIFGNVLALVVLFKSARKHKWRVFYKMITALSCIDLLGILTTSPVVIAVYVCGLQWVIGKPLCDYVSFMLIFSGLSTCLIISAMAIDRYVAIVHPFKYRIFPKDRIVKFALFGILIASMIISLCPLFGLGRNVMHFPGTWCFPDFYDTVISQRVFSYFYSLTICLLVILTATLNIWACARLVVGKRSDVRRDSNISNTGSSKSRRHVDVYVMILLIVIFIVFAVCWLPFVIRILINQFVNATDHEDKVINLYTLRLASLNQILDPWVYLLFRKESLRKCLEHVVKNRAPRRISLFSYTSQRSNPLEQDGFLEKYHEYSPSYIKKLSESSMRTIESNTEF